MGVFINILNINSRINLDAVAKNKYWQWTGNMALINVGLMFLL